MDRKVGEGVITIQADPVKVRVEHAVIHEILHRLLDPILLPHMRYHLIELFYTTLEEELFTRLSAKDQARWRRAIRRRMIAGRKLK